MKIISHCAIQLTSVFSEKGDWAGGGEVVYFSRVGNFGHHTHSRTAFLWLPKLVHHWASNIRAEQTRAKICIQAENLQW